MPSRTRGPRRIALHGLLAAVFVLFASAPASSDAQETPSGDPGTLRVELNKLEALESACRAYLLFENRTDLEFSSLKLDLVMFNPEGVINRRLAVEGGPLPAGKTSVKLFDIDGVSCGSVDRVLLNGILACSDTQGNRNDCLAFLETGSRSSADFFK